MSEYYEIRRNGTWTEAPLHLDVDMSEAVGEELDRLVALYSAHPLSLRRDYDLYAILANYRNDIGVEPIAFPRGLPDDVSETVQASVMRVSQNITWYTLDELLRFDWDQPLRDLNPTEEQLRYRRDNNLHTYRDVAEYTGFVSRALPFLQEQGADPEDVRMVLWFDS